MNWSGKRVLITGHTGFKGGWLTLVLERMGAELCGLALEPPTTPSLFEVAQVGRSLRHIVADLRDAAAVERAVAGFRPEIVFHLAAQPLVRASYADPLTTYATNVQGTANLLEALRRVGSARAAVVVTSDKCYRNSESGQPFRESDPLGGHDPYSNSKACAELVTASYRDSFFAASNYERHGLALATARAGNVIGGGDWATDRLLPDLIQAFAAGRPLRLRSPHAVRPWQHVLEPLRGYRMLAETLFDHGPAFAEAWNFGPHAEDARPVGWIADHCARLWGEGASWQLDGQPQPHEAQTLRLDCRKAHRQLGWQPRLDLTQALDLTIAWHRAHLRGDAMRELTLAQIDAFEAMPSAILLQGACA